jgi:hypothetical protein
MPDRSKLAVSAGSRSFRVLVGAVVGWCAFVVAVLPGLQLIDEHDPAHIDGARVVCEAVFIGGAVVLGFLLATVGQRLPWAWVSVYFGTPLLLVLGGVVAENSPAGARTNTLDSWGPGVRTAGLFAVWGFAVLTMSAAIGLAMGWMWRHRPRARAAGARK